MATKLRSQIRNGNMYYIIGSNNIEDATVVIVKTIAERNALPETGGFVIVTNPLAGPIQDTTVHRGWAMYLRTSAGAEGVKWIKIAEEESVEGIWGINEELLRQFATRAMLEKHILEQRDKNTTFAATAEKVDELVRLVSEVLKHPLITRIGVKNNFPTWKIAIGQGAFKEIFFKDIFIYDNHEGDQLIWKNPAFEEGAPETVSSSFDIATKFLTSGLAFPGETLRVVECDNSITEFLIYAKGDGLAYRFVSSSKVDNVAYVDELPEPSEAYSDQGLFYLLPTADSPYEVGKFYKCVVQDDVFVWKKQNADGERIVYAEEDAGKIIGCFFESFDSVRITYTNPPLVSGDKHWLRTSILRKVGGEPQHHKDGIVVYTTPGYNAESENGNSENITFIDHVAFTGAPVYYSIVAETTKHEIYVSPLIIKKAEFPNSLMIKRLVNDGTFGKVFEVGDVFTSEMLDGIGKSVRVAVTKIQDDEVCLTAIDSLGKFVFDGVEHGMKPTTRTSWDSGVRFYQAVTSSDGRTTHYNPVEASDFSGSPVDNNLFEAYGDGLLYNPCFDASNAIKHGSNDYLSSNLIRWLNGDLYPFTPAHSGDTDGITVHRPLISSSTGTLFDISYDVTLPDEDNGGIGVLATEDREMFWTSDATDIASDSKWIKMAHSVTNGTVSRDRVNAESEADVYPVFIIKKD